MTKKNKLPITEELDFAYLLELMPVLHETPEYAWLPELFSIVGVDLLITLCTYAGGEWIRIPTLEQLADSIEALQWFYNVNVKKSNSVIDVPKKYKDMYERIVNVYNSTDYQAKN